MGFLMGHSAWQIDQFPACWPMNGLFAHWSRGWGVSSFSERLVFNSILIPIPLHSIPIPIPIPLGWKIAIPIPIPFYPSALRAGGVLSSRFGRAGGRAGGCQTCGTHISVTAWRIFSIRSSMELSRPVVVHCHGNLPICPIWACPWAKNLSNLPQIGSRLCGTHISETAGWIYTI